MAIQNYYHTNSYASQLLNKNLVLQLISGIANH